MRKDECISMLKGRDIMSLFRCHRLLEYLSLPTSPEVQRSRYLVWTKGRGHVRVEGVRGTEMMGG
jgi:hypothetical protein